MNQKIKINYYSILQSVLILICLISFFGAIVYRLYSLNNLGVAISLILAIAIFIIILKFHKSDNRPASTKATAGRQQKTSTKNLMLSWVLKPSLTSNLLLITYYLLLITSFYILFTRQTAQAIISPWQIVPNYFFALYGLATAILVIIIIKQKNNNGTMEQWNNGTIFLISLHYFLSFSIAWIIYKIGYGFDPFIHQATMDLIDKTGSVEPKPFYYLGQYSLIVILHKITALPIVWLDKLLVPILAAMYLPITLYKILAKWFENKRSVILTVLFLLILPFSFFIITTPQNFAYLLLLLIILLGLTCSNIFDLIIIYLLALTALIIQPIAGIPALLFALLLSIYHSDQSSKLKKICYLLIFIISTIALPLAFWFVEKNNSGISEAQNPTGFWASLSSLSLPNLTMPNQENFILNFIYLYGFNLKIIITLIVVAGLIIAYKYKQQCQIFFIYILMSLALGLSYALTKILPFNFLIDYERSNFSNRILLIAAFFLLPFILTALYGFINKTLKQNRIIKISLLTFLVILITTSLYLSYPRFDRYHNSHGYSVSQNDIDSVRWIENNATEDYMVLANQQVSAAALREFGFKKYYEPSNKFSIFNLQSPIFYYPIPTGGPLYQYYLDMVYKKPSRQTMIAAMDLVGVNEAYFVLNKYWWAFDKILAEAKLEADEWQGLDNGEIYVFRYKK
ncbi:hypothetical protein KAU19_01060 [Candidatus Parcubacteria bacterium]|nr:hypothetical protein [Candidatus Parcubacteria bacterium]